MSEEVSTFVYEKEKEKKELAKGTLQARTAFYNENMPLVLTDPNGSVFIFG